MTTTLSGGFLSLARSEALLDVDLQQLPDAFGSDANCCRCGFIMLIQAEHTPMLAWRIAFSISGSAVW